ncbi:MAG TPA: membrane protein insertase YidC [Saprospiraceae bacterium]|nr:membrane protein insertase YidC [Saprospiraceae bacterium]HMP26184.1 membrane protein insertase YidC [Saprospiraceae bacterium]
MDRNTIIGIVLIFVLFIIWQQFFVAPEARKQAEAQKRIQDSIAMAQMFAMDTLAQETLPLADTLATANTTPALPDSAIELQRLRGFGAFAAAAQGTEELHTLENEVFKVTFSNKGGRVVEAVLKNFEKISEDERKREVASPLRLLEYEKNRFEYLLPLAGASGGSISTADLYFTATPIENGIAFRANAGNGRFFEQRYVLNAGSYRMDYTLHFEGLQEVLDKNASSVSLNWVNYLDRLEKNTQYERTYSTVYYKPMDGHYNYCSYTSDDVDDLSGRKTKWVSHSNQFFNSALIAKESFDGAVLKAEQLDVSSERLKKLSTECKVPFNHTSSETFAMDFYVGPNEFDRLRAIGYELEDVIPFGWSIFGTINRWIIRPIFNFLSTFIGSKGIVILFLTLIVKLLLYPLTYRMLYSQSKMGALKPQLEALKEKLKGDQQQQQVETMKIYRENGVNPLGGCLPMLMQMPIWFALYRFFPAAIEFRQASFLWATDLSSYDVFFRLPFEIPLGFGSHVSLFTLLWAVTTLIYTYYNTKHMDMSANPAMKYMQYIMPVMFLGFFNSFASGLTCYLLFSNILNILQTIVTKNYIIDQEKIKRELEAYRKKPKKKGGFQERLETAMKEQRRIQEQRDAEQKKKRTKK